MPFFDVAKIERNNQETIIKKHKTPIKNNNSLIVILN